MNPMLLFQKDTSPQQAQAMSALNILLGGLGRGPAAKPLSPSLGLPGKKPEPITEQSLLGGIKNG